jgi:hypothetical protein
MSINLIKFQELAKRCNKCIVHWGYYEGETCCGCIAGTIDYCEYHNPEDPTVCICDECEPLDMGDFETPQEYADYMKATLPKEYFDLWYKDHIADMNRPQTEEEYNIQYGEYYV